jgi:hypothetical protein
MNASDVELALMFVRRNALKSRMWRSLTSQSASIVVPAPMNARTTVSQSKRNETIIHHPISKSFFPLGINPNFKIFHDVIISIF